MEVAHIFEDQLKANKESICYITNLLRNWNKCYKDQRVKRPLLYYYLFLKIKQRCLYRERERIVVINLRLRSAVKEYRRGAKLLFNKPVYKLKPALSKSMNRVLMKRKKNRVFSYRKLVRDTPEVQIQFLTNWRGILKNWRRFFFIIGLDIKASLGFYTSVTGWYNQVHLWVLFCGISKFFLF